MSSIQLNARLIAHLELLAEAQGTSIEALITQWAEQPSSVSEKKASIALDTMINTMPAYIFVIERGTMLIMYCNDMFAQIVGYKERGDIEGKTVYDCFPPEQANYFVAQNHQVFDGKNVHIIETLNFPDGVHHVDTYKIGLRNDQGAVFALLGISYDVTELENTRRELASITEQLQASEERYRAISELSMDYAYAYRRGDDGQFHLEWITDAFSTATGYPSEEFEILQLQEKMIYPNDLESYRAIIDRLMNQAEEISFKFRLLRKDGELCYFQTNWKSVLNTQTNQVETIYGSTRDLTEQTLAEATLNQERTALREIMQTSPAGLTVIDPTGTITFANDRAEVILGLEKSEIIGKTYNAPTWHITDFDGQPFPEENLPFQQVLRTKHAVYNIQHAIQWEDGKRVYLSVSGAPVLDSDGNVVFAVLHVEDISLRIESEALIRTNLEREKQLNQLKSRFISVITHELRTPLAIINISADLLQRTYDGSNLDAFNERIKKIHNQVDFLKRVTDEVGFIHKQEQVGYVIHWENIDLKQFASMLLEELAIAYAKMPQINIEIPEHSVARLDETLLHHILFNLLSNAVKYARTDDPSVTLKIQCGDETITFEVHDNGIGISEEDQAQIFGSFHRGSNVDNIAGIGLGLVIVKMAVDIFGGTITVQSALGEGTSFIVTLPKTTPEVNETE